MNDLQWVAAPPSRERLQLAAIGRVPEPAAGENASVLSVFRELLDDLAIGHLHAGKHLGGVGPQHLFGVLQISMDRNHGLALEWAEVDVIEVEYIERVSHLSFSLKKKAPPIRERRLAVYAATTRFLVGWVR
jgi:hypothetical protein